MRIERIWAIPSKSTFTIKPIADLLEEELTEGLWIDPLCGENSPAHIRNDLNPKIQAEYHMEAIDFLKIFEDESVDGVLYDPLYTQGGSSFWSEIKNEIARIVKPTGKVICCGWNSMGIGITREFKITRILLVPHGGNHNDTIVTVEVKSSDVFAGVTNDEELIQCRHA